MQCRTHWTGTIILLIQGQQKKYLCHKAVLSVFVPLSEVNEGEHWDFVIEYEQTDYLLIHLELKQTWTIEKTTLEFFFNYLPSLFPIIAFLTVAPEEFILGISWLRFYPTLCSYLFITVRNITALPSY